jgi:gas vesicle protein
MNNLSKIAASFAAGIIAGSAAAIWFAPAKGAETRNQIAAAGKKFTALVKKKTEILPDLEADMEEAVQEAVTTDADEII